MKLPCICMAHFAYHSSRVGSTRLEAVTLRRCLIRKVAALLLGARCLR